MYILSSTYDLIQISFPIHEIVLNNDWSIVKIVRRLVLEKAVESGYYRFQPGEGPSRGLLRDYEPSDGTF